MRLLLSAITWFAFIVTSCAGFLLCTFSLMALHKNWKVPRCPRKVSVCELVARGGGADKFVRLTDFLITGCVVLEEEMAGHKHMRPTGRWAEVMAVAVPQDGVAPQSITIANAYDKIALPTNGLLIRSNQVRSEGGLEEMARRGILAQLEGWTEIKGPAGRPVQCLVVREMGDVDDWRSYALRLGVGLGLIVFPGLWVYRAIKSGECW